MECHNLGVLEVEIFPSSLQARVDLKADHSAQLFEA